MLAQFLGDGFQEVTFSGNISKQCNIEGNEKVGQLKTRRLVERCSVESGRDGNMLEQNQENGEDDQNSK